MTSGGLLKSGGASDARGGVGRGEEEADKLEGTFDGILKVDVVVAVVNQSKQSGSRKRSGQ